MTQFQHQEIVIRLYKAVGQGFTLARVNIFPFKDNILQKNGKSIVMSDYFVPFLAWVSCCHEHIRDIYHYI